MPKVTFLQDKLIVEALSGAKLHDIVDRSGATLPFGCRLGSCGTCRCLVVEGMENVNPLTAAESELFESLTSIHPNERLGCQLIIYGDVKIQS
jgi:ferredoxin